MCYQAFIGSHQALDISYWTQANVFYLSAQLSNEQRNALKDKLDYPFVYIMETFEGCGCKFKYDPTDYDLSDCPEALLQGLDLDQLQQEETHHTASILRLLPLLRHACMHGPVALYFTWFDELDQPIEVEKTRSISQVNFPEYYWQFEDNMRLVVTA